MSDTSAVLVDVVTIFPQPLFCAWLLHRLLPLRHSIRFILLYAGVILGLHTLFVWVWSVAPFLKAGATFAISILFIYPFGRGRRLTALIFLSACALLMLLAELLTICLALWVLRTGPVSSTAASLRLLSPHILPLRFAYAFCFLLLLALTFYFWKRICNGHTAFSTPTLLPFLLLHGTMVLCGEIALLLSGSSSTFLFFWVLITVLLSGGAVAAVLWLYRQEQVRHELFLRHQSLVLQSHALQTEQSATVFYQKQVKDLQTELAYRLQEAQSLLGSSAVLEAKDCLSQTARWLSLQKPPQFCSNLVVNTVMVQQALRCRDAGIRLKSSLDLPQTLCLEEYELCSVFFNLLDNAVQACSVLPEAAREIHLSAAVRGGYLIIKERNPLPPTRFSSQTSRERGLGLGILAEIAQRRDGDLEVLQNRGQFSITIWLRPGAIVPVQRNESSSAGDHDLSTPGNLPPSTNTLIPLLTLPLSQLALGGAVLFLWLGAPTSLPFGALALLALLSFSSDLLLLRIFRQMRLAQQLQSRTLTLEADIRLHQTYLKQLEQASTQLRRIRHDLNNHLQTVSLLITGGAHRQAEAYLRGLTQVFLENVPGDERSN